MFRFTWSPTFYTFPSTDFSCVPDGGGVYRWRIDRKPEKPDLYIGMSEKSLRRRLFYYVTPNSKSTNLRVSSWLRCALRHRWPIHLELLDESLQSPQPDAERLERLAIAFHKAQGNFTVRNNTLALMKCFPECTSGSPHASDECYMYCDRSAQSGDCSEPLAAPRSSFR
jgi:hypothetical protein